MNDEIYQSLQDIATNLISRLLDERTLYIVDTFSAGVKKEGCSVVQKITLSDERDDFENLVQMIQSDSNYIEVHGINYEAIYEPYEKHISRCSYIKVDNEFFRYATQAEIEDFENIILMQEMK